MGAKATSSELKTYSIKQNKSTRGTLPHEKVLDAGRGTVRGRKLYRSGAVSLSWRGMRAPGAVAGGGQRAGLTKSAI